MLNTELSGLKKEAVQIELDDATLVIHGEREVNEDKYYRMERSFWQLLSPHAAAVRGFNRPGLAR